MADKISIIDYVREGVARNDMAHADIKKDINEIKKMIAPITPKVAANEKAIAIILIILAVSGFLKAFGAF